MEEKKYIDEKMRQHHRRNTWSFIMFLLLVTACFVMHAWQVKHHHVQPKPVAVERVTAKPTVPPKATKPQVKVDTCMSS